MKRTEKKLVKRKIPKQVPYVPLPVIPMKFKLEMRVTTEGHVGEFIINSSYLTPYTRERYYILWRPAGWKPPKNCKGYSVHMIAPEAKIKKVR